MERKSHIKHSREPLSEGTLVLVVFIHLFIFSIPAQVSQEEIDILKTEYSDYREDATSEFDVYKQLAIEEHTRYLKQSKAEYQAYQNALKRIWG